MLESTTARLPRSLVANIGWLVADKVIRLIGGFIVGVLIARHLGPGEYGLWNYALAFSSLFVAVAGLGLDSIVIRDILRDDRQRPSLLATAFLLKLIAGIGALALALGSISLVRQGDTVLVWLVGLSGIGFVFQAAQVIDFDYQAHGDNHLSVIAQISAFLVMALAKLALLAYDAPVVAFAAAGAVEVAMGMMFLVATFRWRGQRLDLRQASCGLARRLLADSWPLMLSGIAISLYMRIDQVMLGALAGDRAVGVYSAAVRLSELWYFLPMAISTAVFPAIIELRKGSPETYRRRMQQYFDAMSLIGLAIALVMTFIGPALVLMLYGQDYASAGPLLVIHIWAGVFVYLGIASGNWLAAEGLQIYSLARTVLGCTSSIALNIYLIPRMGAMGAVLGVLMAQGIATFSLLFFPRARRCGIMSVLALMPYRLFVWK